MIALNAFLALIVIAASPLSVRDTGATGDGITDDSPAIQKALDTAAFVSVPAGVYRLGKRIELRANQHLRIEAGATLKPHATLPVGQALLHVAGVANVIIEGPGVLDGDPASNPVGKRFGVQVDSGASFVTIRGLTSQNMPSDGVGNNGGDGIYVGGETSNFPGLPTDILIDGCNLLNNARKGCSLTSGSHIKLTNCTIRDGAGTGIGIEPNRLTSPLDGVMLSGNHITGNRGGGIGGGSAGLGGICIFHLSLIGNHLINNGDAMTRELTIKTARDVVVTGNTFEHSACDALFLLSDSRRALVANNEFRGGKRGMWVSQTTATSGLTRTVSVATNNFMGQVTAGIYGDVSDLFGVSFSGNSIANDAGTADNAYVGISLMSGCTASGNVMALEKGRAGIAVTDKKGSGAVVSGNAIQGAVFVPVSLAVGAPHQSTANVMKP